MKTYMKNKIVFKWYGDEILNQIASMKEKDEALASVRIHRDVMRNVPTGEYKRSYRQKYVNSKGDLVPMKYWQKRTPGTLRRSIQRQKSKYKGGGYTVSAGNDYAYYMRMVEYGTKMRRQKTTGRFTGKAPAAKYMRKPLRMERTRFINSFKQSMTQLRGMNE